MITDQQFAGAAAIIKCDVSAIKAVYQVEAAGKGFLEDGKVRILFEGHRFWKQLLRAGVLESYLITTAKDHPNVLYKIWDRKQYKGGDAEWTRMAEAIGICQLAKVSEECALKSASYGAFQIMGENCIACGYPNAAAMGDAYKLGEDEQLDSFVRFLQYTHLDDELRNHQWAQFAAGYNGTGYKLNHYDLKLATAYKTVGGA